MSSIDETHENTAGGPSESRTPSASEAMRNSPSIPEADVLRSLRNNTLAMEPPDSFSALEIDDESESNLLRDGGAGTTAKDISLCAAQLVGQELSDAVLSTPGQGGGVDKKDEYFVAANEGAISEYNAATPGVLTSPPVTQLMSPADVAGQLLASSKLASLRSPTTFPVFKAAVASAPILANPKCSGYFVEPVSPPLQF